MNSEHAPLNLGGTFLRRSILNRLSNGPHTAESLAAVLNVELHLKRATLAGLVPVGSVIETGALKSIPRPASQTTTRARARDPRMNWKW